MEGFTLVFHVEVLGVVLARCKPPFVDLIALIVVSRLVLIGAAILLSDLMPFILIETPTSEESLHWLSSTSNAS